MKKLYRKGTVHPSPPIISDQLSFLPATILTLTAALTPEDREVLAYLISCSSSSNNPRRTTTTATSRSSSASGGGDHGPVFSCNCFRCYMSYWVRWDSSPNRQLIHEIIDAFEEWLAQKGGKKQNNNGGGRKEKRNKRGSNNNKKMQQTGELLLNRTESVASSESTESSSTELESAVVVVENSSNDSEDGENRVEEDDKGSVRRFVSFIGERIWGAWGQ
ncbi:hypothetical protein PIB30_034762 [Stylosanthes scabra]|uniref:Uncharacterized protein n=1 Tax=Stylosanthes scabra TaxID=79078 RepID=A0ABU6ZCC3_9FABA|nr:hypothetical protein [Stylosanthes scabra]